MIHRFYLTGYTPFIISNSRAILNGDTLTLFNKTPSAQFSQARMLIGMLAECIQFKVWFDLVNFMSFIEIYLKPPLISIM
jgi:hypothetical protein